MLEGEVGRGISLLKEKEDLTAFCITLKNALQENQIRSKNDHKVLEEGLNDLRNKREKIDEINKLRNERITEKDKARMSKLLPTGVVSTKQLPIEDYLTRLRTTSIHNAKFAETIDILLNLLNMQVERGEDQIKNIISHDENYKVFLKGLGSKN